MLTQFLTRLFVDLEIEKTPLLDENKTISFSLNEDIEIHFQEIDNTIYIYSIICPCPLKRREELFIYLMKANFLAQGTGGTTIGLDQEEKYLTLSWFLAYELDYREFKEKLEDFVNYLVYWRNEINQFLQKAKESII